MKRRTTRLPALLCILLITITGMFLVSCDSGNERTPTQAAKTTLDALKDQNLNVLKTTYAGDASDFSLNTDQLLGRTYKLNKHEKKTVNKLIRKLLESAAANAMNNQGLREDTLYVAECYANQAPTMKRIQPRAQGRAYRILKRSSHITVVLDEKK